MTNWVPTSEAAKLCYCHPRTLKRKRDIEGGILINFVHWRFGATAGSYCLWNIDEVLKLFNYQGLIQHDKLKERIKQTKTAEDISDLMGA